MTGRSFTSVLLTLIVVLLPLRAVAGDLMMVRSSQSFPETMLALQESIKEHGYTVSRVQRVDIGLTRSGFKTDKYRVVFFGKLEEVNELASDHPEVIPYLPLKIVVFAEETQTLVVTANPIRYLSFYDNARVRTLAHRWASDLNSILDDMRTLR